MKFPLCPAPVLACLALLAACGAPGLNLEYYRDLDLRVVRGDYDGARQRVLESQKELYGDKSRVVFLMDNAMIDLLAGRYDDAVRHVDAAEKAIEELYTKSLTREAASFLTSDAILPYEGEDYEKVFLNAVGALGYALLGKADEAIVEAKRADLKLSEIRRVHPQNAYSDDGFVRFLMGLMYEGGGETNDAWVSYAQAIKVYEQQAPAFGVIVPVQLVRRAYACANRLGFREEAEGLRTRYPAYLPEGLPVPDPAGGRVVLVHLAGMAPFKVENRIEVTLGNGLAYVQAMQVQSDEESKVSTAMTVAKSVVASDNLVITFPSIAKRPPDWRAEMIALEGPGTLSIPTESVQDFGSIAPKCLEERMGRIWARTVARVVVKYLIAYGLETAAEAGGGKDYGWIAGLITGATARAVMNASEFADTRGWGTLPYEVRMAVLDVPAGKHRFVARSGDSIVREYPGIEVAPGRTAWLVLRTH